MEYRSTQRSNRDKTWLNRSKSENFKNINSCRNNVSNKRISTKAERYDYVRCSSKQNCQKNLPDKSNIVYETVDPKLSYTESCSKISNDKRINQSESKRVVTNDITSYFSNNNNSTTSVSSQCNLLIRKESNKYSKGQHSNLHQNPGRSNLVQCSNNNKKRKRNSTPDDNDNTYEPESKRTSIMEPMGSSQSYIPIASTSSSYMSSGILHSKTPNSYQSSEINSAPSSIGSSSFSSSFSPSPGPEIDEFIENEIDARSSSSYMSTGVEFDFVPSSDESTMISENSVHTLIEHKSHHNMHQENVKDISKNFATPHKIRALTPSSDIRPCPLPALSWANASDVWNLMCRNDEKAGLDRSSTMLDNHCGLQPRMRAILLDWLIEVCEVYKLHRETYYLAVDYLDRYLSTQKNVQKTHLQLIGITCLFVAAKVEEIYPPKIGEFAYVTDGACHEEDILQHELLLLSALGWSITPVTIMGWLGIYMQLNVNNRSATTFMKNKSNATNKNPMSLSSKISSSNNVNVSGNSQDKNASFKENNNVNINNNNYSSCEKDAPYNKNKTCNEKLSHSSSLFENDSGISICSGEIDDSFIYPQFSGFEFSQTAQLIDLCTLDLGNADFNYSVIAAAAMSHTFGRETSIRVSGYEWESLVKCAKWMEPFFEVIKDEAQYFVLGEQNEQIQSKHGLGIFCPKIVTDESHTIQTHSTSITMLEEALLRREQRLNQCRISQPEASPATKSSKHLYSEGLLTPPASSRKPVDDEDDDDVADSESELHNIKS